MTRPTESLTLSALLTALAATLLVSASGLMPAARGVPVAVAVPTLGILAWLLVAQVRQTRQHTLAPVRAGGSERDPAALSRAEAETLVWMGLLLALLWTLGMLVGLPLYLLLYLRLRSDERWPTVLALTASTWLLLFAGLALLLRVRLYEGIVWSWLNRP